LSDRTVRTAALLLLSGAALLSGGCGGSWSGASASGLRLQREDLIATVRALQGTQGEATDESKASKVAWPHVANGLPADPGSIPATPIATASRLARALRLPGLFGELKARTLTGPASGLAGLYRSYAGLAAVGWQQIQYAIGRLQRGPPSAAAFARENVALYIESVYDAHFSLAQLGKQLLAGYKKLGGPPAFGHSLAEAEVEALADTYSEANFRLHPHVGVRLGS
jgi:hypothetical protein